VTQMSAAETVCSDIAAARTSIPSRVMATASAGNHRGQIEARAARLCLRYRWSPAEKNWTTAAPWLRRSSQLRERGQADNDIADLCEIMIRKIKIVFKRQARYSGSSYSADRAKFHDFVESSDALYPDNRPAVRACAPQP
jgi:hypothetical protein